MMSSAPCLLSASMIAGTSVLWPAASVVTPTACTSFSIAWRAHSSGVWNSGPMSTSKPRSAKAVATTLAPRSWPSWPSLAIITRGRRPCSSANASISCLQLFPALGRVVGGGVHAGHLLRVGAMAAPDLFQRVADLADRGAQAHRLDRSGRAGCPCRFRRPRVSAASAACTAAPSRFARIALQPRDLRRRAPRRCRSRRMSMRVLGLRACTC